jgi:hypothetical protein
VCQIFNGESLNGNSDWYYVMKEDYPDTYTVNTQPGWAWSGAVNTSQPGWPSNATPTCSNNPPNL